MHVGRLTCRSSAPRYHGPSQGSGHEPVANQAGLVKKMTQKNRRGPEAVGEGQSLASAAHTVAEIAGWSLIVRKITQLSEQELRHIIASSCLRIICGSGIRSGRARHACRQAVLWAEATFFPLIPTFAAAMARGYASFTY